MPPTPIVKPKESPVQGVQTRQVRFYDGGSVRNNNTTQVHSPSSSPGESRQHTNFVDPEDFSSSTASLDSLLALQTSLEREAYFEYVHPHDTDESIHAGQEYTSDQSGQGTKPEPARRQILRSDSQPDNRQQGMLLLGSVFFC